MGRSMSLKVMSGHGAASDMSLYMKLLCRDAMHHPAAQRELVALNGPVDELSISHKGKE